jgi:hypothetical protein
MPDNRTVIVFQPEEKDEEKYDAIAQNISDISEKQYTNFALHPLVFVLN